MGLQKLEEPLNAGERYLYAISVRLDVLIESVNKLMEVYTNQIKPVEVSKTEAVVAPKNVVKEDSIPIVPVKKPTKVSKK